MCVFSLAQGEQIFDDFIHLVRGQQAPQADILAFDGRKLGSDLV